MAENTFNPNDWMPEIPAPVPTSSSSAPVAGDLADDIEVVTLLPVTTTGWNLDSLFPMPSANLAVTTSTGSVASTKAMTRPNVTASTTSACAPTEPASQPRHSSRRPKTQESASVPAPYLQNPQLMQNLHIANLRIPLQPYLHKTKMRILRILPKLQIWKMSR